MKKMKTILYLTVTLMSSMFCNSSYAQLSFKVDSIQLHTISDYPEDFLKEILLSESYEASLLYGPYFTICGKLINSSPNEVVYYASADKGSFGLYFLAKTKVKISFKYRGRIYEITDYPPVWLGEGLNPVYLKSEWANYHDNWIGDTEVCMLIIPGNSTVLAEVRGAFLYYSKWCHTRDKNSSREFTEKDMKNSRKLERIAKEILPTMKVSLEIKHDWDAWSRILAKGSKVYD